MVRKILGRQVLCSTVFRSNFSGKFLQDKSVIVGNVKHVRFLSKLSWVACIVICTIPFEIDFMVSTAVIGNDCGIVCSFRRFTMVSEIKFAVAHVSNNARHLTSSRLLL